MVSQVHIYPGGQVVIVHVPLPKPFSRQRRHLLQVGQKIARRLLERRLRGVGQLLLEQLRNFLLLDLCGGRRVYDGLRAQPGRERRLLRTFHAAVGDEHVDPRLQFVLLHGAVLKSLDGHCRGLAEVVDETGGLLFHLLGRGVRKPLFSSRTRRSCCGELAVAETGAWSARTAGPAPAERRKPAANAARTSRTETLVRVGMRWVVCAIGRMGRLDATLDRATVARSFQTNCSGPPVCHASVT